MCSMAAFKKHAVFGFWKDSLIKGLAKARKKDEQSMGSLGRIEKMSDLPSDTLLKKLIKEAMELNDKGIKIPNAGRKSDHHLEIPRYLSDALRKNKKAKEVFDNFSYTNKRDYVEWVSGARNEETRNDRLKTAVEWMSEGKTRFWKYIEKK